MKKTKHVISCIVEYQKLGQSRGEPKLRGPYGPPDPVQTPL